MDTLNVFHESLPRLATLYTVGASMAHGLLMYCCVRVDIVSFLELMAAISTGEIRAIHMHVPAVAM